MSEDDNTVNLSITFLQDGISTYSKYKTNKVIKDLLVAYCEKKQLVYEEIRFLYYGKRLAVTKTPSQLGMKDGDHIEACMSFHGGGLLGHLAMY